MRSVFRMLIGGILFAHGSQKLLGWFGGQGLAGTIEEMEEFQLHPTRVNAVTAAVAEAGGGALMVGGLFTPLACRAMATTMTVATVVSAPNGFWAREDGLEYPLLLTLSALLIAAEGPGAASLDHALGRERSGRRLAMQCAAEAMVAAAGIFALARSRRSTTGTPTFSRPTEKASPQPL